MESEKIAVNFYHNQDQKVEHIYCEDTGMDERKQGQKGRYAESAHRGSEYRNLFGKVLSV